MYPSSSRAPRLHDRLPSISRSQRTRTALLSRLYASPLDRIQVLGDDAHGHSGCVNALSWAQNGEVLLSGGDDRTVRIWRHNQGLPADSGESTYPALSSCAVIDTGHSANIFNARMLPYSTRIATVAGDRQVRVFDIGEAGFSGKDSETEYWNARTHLLLCHEDRVKRIVTEESPDVFLTVSEDGTVRQHDLRRAHSCRSDCPPPLVQMDHELTSLAMSPLRPYQFVVAGQSSFGYLFDRRNLKTKRTLDSPRGGLTICTRLFGRPVDATSAGSEDNDMLSYLRREHVTGVRMNSTNSDEVLIAYSGDCVYRFSTLGGTSDDLDTPPSSVLANGEDADMDWDEPPSSESRFPDNPSDTPVILPVQRYVGARNVETVKDVNFLGPRSEYVSIGSDDGNFFIWHKDSGKLHGIYEGDSSIVNVIEGHPHLPVIATSGIDTTVKLFAPKLDKRPSEFARTANADNIMNVNAQPGRRAPLIRRLDMVRFMREVQSREGGQDTDEEIPCTSQ